MTHTPGSWRVSEHSKDFYEITTSDFNIAVAEVNTLADARLIAAAPDAIALARAVAEHFQDTDAPLGQLARDWLAKATKA